MIFLEFSVNFIKLVKVAIFVCFFLSFLKFCVKVTCDQTLEEYKYWLFNIFEGLKLYSDE